MKKYIMLLLVAILVQSKTFAIGTKSTMNKIMDSWIGANINTVIDCWGYPTKEETIVGRKLYYWIDKNFVVSSNQYGVYGGDTTCNRILEVDKENNVVKWQWTGNSCPATYFTSQKWVNPDNNPWKKNTEL